MSSKEMQESVPGLSIKIMLNYWLMKNYQLYLIVTHKYCTRMQEFAC
jgi:hypothetical protein